MWLNLCVKWIIESRILSFLFFIVDLDMKLIISVKVCDMFNLV